MVTYEQRKALEEAARAKPPTELELVTIIADQSNPELAKLPGHVWQVWEDGEVTLQKCGELLWQRNLHMVQMGDSAKAVSPTLFPHQSHDGEHGYIFTTEEGAMMVRAAIFATLPF